MIKIDNVNTEFRRIWNEFDQRDWNDPVRLKRGHRHRGHLFRQMAGNHQGGDRPPSPNKIGLPQTQTLPSTFLVFHC